MRERLLRYNDMTLQKPVDHIKPAEQTEHRVNLMGASANPNVLKQGRSKKQQTVNAIVCSKQQTTTKIGSCALKASVDRVSVDTLGRYVERQSADMSSDSRPIYRPLLGRDSVDISADCRSTRMSGDTLRYFTATRPTLGRYFTDTRPALRSFGQLLLLSSIFSTQLLNNLF